MRKRNYPLLTKEVKNKVKLKSRAYKIARTRGLGISGTSNKTKIFIEKEKINVERKFASNGFCAYIKRKIITMKNTANILMVTDSRS